MEEIVCDYDAFRQAAFEFRRNPLLKMLKKWLTVTPDVILTTWKLCGGKYKVKLRGYLSSGSGNSFGKLSGIR